MTNHPLRLRAFVLLAFLCFWLIGCELEETLVLNADGSGTYSARILLPKEFAGAIGDLKAKATAEGFQVVEESETVDRKVLVIRKDFRDVSELNDNSNHYSLRVDQSSKWKRAYELSLDTGSGSGDGIQKRTMTIVLPVAVTSATSGTVTGREVRWDATSGGSIHVAASGYLLPFGMTPLQTGIALAAVAAASLLFLRGRRPRTCPACGVGSDGSARFCGSCGVKVTRQRLVSPMVGGIVAGALLLTGVVFANIPRLAALLDRIKPKEVSKASVAPVPAAPGSVADPVAVAQPAVPTTTIGSDGPTTTLPQGVFQGTVVASDVLELQGGMRVELSGNQDGGCPFFGAGHSGEVAWDVSVGDRLEIDGTVFRFTDDNKWSMTPKAPFGVMANRITILSRK